MKLLLQHIVCAALAGACTWGQTTPGFEAASVKPSASNGRSSMRGGPGTSEPGQITYTNATLSAIVIRAYDLKSYQLDAPDWFSSLRYDVAAKIPPGATREQFGPMLQALLAERFHLALHHETRPLPGYELAAVASKLKPSQDGSAPPADLSTPPKRDANGYPQLDAPGMALMEGIRGKAVVVYMTARAQPVSALTDLLSREFRMPILDKTGLSGKFDFQLEFAPQRPGALETTLPAEDSAPDLTAAVRSQLGLQLHPAKIPVEVLIIDRADRVPVAN